MKKQKTLDLVFQLSAITLLIGAAGCFPNPALFKWVLAAGVAGYCITSMLSQYPGESIRGKRLHNMHVLAAIIMIAATVMLFMNRRDWVLLLAGAAFLTLYSAILMPIELKREKKERQEKQEND
jgi:phosphatidylserine synthase